MPSPLRKQVELYMTLQGLSESTRYRYIYAMEQLAKHYWRPLDTVTGHEVHLYLDKLINERKLNWSTINIYCSAYRYLYNTVLGRDEKTFSIPRRRGCTHRPKILSREEVLRIINAAESVKHQALLSLVYGSGLRVSEVIKIQPKHVCRDRMTLFIEQAKGHKDRYTILSNHSLQLLEKLWSDPTRTGPFFFSSTRRGNQYIGITTAQKIYYSARERANVRNTGGIHVLRHCFATHLMERKENLCTIQKLMGHKSIKTTAVYTHVTTEHIQSIRSPLDTP